MKYIPQQFRSTQRVNPGAYSQAAQNLTNAANHLYEINRKTAPDFSKLAMTQMNINTALAKKGIETQSDLTKAGILVKGQLQWQKEILKGEESARKAKRAGKLMLFGGGALMQGMKMAGRKKIEKPEPIYGVETPFKYPDSPYKGRIESGENGGIGPAPTRPDPKDRSTWDTTFPQIPNNNSGAMDTPPPTPPAEIRTQPTGGFVSQSQMQTLLMNNGMSAENARLGAAVGMAESRGEAGTDTVKSGLDPHKRNEFSVGLWQINTQAHQDKLDARGWTADDLRDPNKNAQMAIEVFNEAGGFTPWSVWNNGKAQQYL